MHVVEFGAAQKALKLLAQIKRERDLVDKSIVSDAAKQKLYAALDHQQRTIEAALEEANMKAYPQGSTGAVQAPQTPAKRA